MKFSLIDKSRNGTIAKLHIMNSNNDIVGSVAVEESEVSDLLRHWQGPKQSQAQAKQTSPVETLVNAFRARKMDSKTRQSVYFVAAEDLTAIWRVVRCSVHLQDNFDLSVDFLGRRALDSQNFFVVELSGRHLGYQIQHDNTALFLRLREMDGPEEWQSVLSLLDTVNDWETVYDLIARLEKHSVRSLKRPIQIGHLWDAGDCIVIS